MNLTAIARPYAKAAFSTAVESNTVAQWSEALKILEQTFAETTLAGYVRDPRLQPSRWIEEVIKVLGERLSAVQQQFLRLLAEKRRLLAIPEITALFEAQRAAAESRLNVQVTSALPLTSEEKTLLATSLERRWKQKVELVFEQDASLIGGVIIKSGDAVIDASLRGHLAALADTLSA